MLNGARFDDSGGSVEVVRDVAPGQAREPHPTALDVSGIVALMAVTGVRVGEALGLRREDMHLLASSKSVGCPVAGPHVHIRRRQNADLQQRIGELGDKLQQRDAALAEARAERERLQGKLSEAEDTVARSGSP